MESTIVSAIALLALIVWRFVFARLERRLRSGGNAAAPDTLDQRRSVLEEPCVWGFTGYGWNPGSYRIDPIGTESRAEAYLHRVVAAIGAAQKGSGYILAVGTTRFQVRDRYVRRLRDVNDPKCAYEETCFYSVFRMPKAEQIAAALLQLRNNPALFERWARQRDVAFKADGQVFAPVR